MPLKLASVQVRAFDRTGITSEDEAQTKILARAIAEEMGQIGVCVGYNAANTKQTTNEQGRPSYQLVPDLFSSEDP